MLLHVANTTPSGSNKNHNNNSNKLRTLTTTSSSSKTRAKTAATAKRLSTVTTVTNVPIVSTRSAAAARDDMMCKATLNTATSTTHQSHAFARAHNHAQTQATPVALKHGSDGSNGGAGHHIGADNNNNVCVVAETKRPSLVDDGSNGSGRTNTGTGSSAAVAVETGADAGACATACHVVKQCFTKKQ